MTVLSTISVRPMCDGEEKAVKALARRTFHPLGNLSFPTSADALVAERNGELVGAVVLRTFSPPGGRRGSVMMWLMTASEVRRLGVGRRLVEAALRSFEERDCQEVFACVEGLNTSSANVFAGRGLTILSFGEQLRRYGFLGTLQLWLRTPACAGTWGTSSGRALGS